LRALFLVLAALFMLTTSGAQAADLQKGLAAYDAEDYETAFAEFSALAEEGHAEAQYNLALMYFLGTGVAQDYVVAAKWYALAAEQEYAKAQSNLAWMYYLGRGVAQNHTTAVKWYRLAAEQGDVYGQYSLATMYYNGDGVAQDDLVALMWANIAAENGKKKDRPSEKHPPLVGIAAEELADSIAEKMSQAGIERAEQMARACMESDYKNCGP